MKKSIKELLPAFILGLVTSFMLCVFEPIIMYSSNINDFWFDFKLMLGQLVLMFISMFAFISLVCVIVYIVNKKFIKKINIYNICLIIGYILFIILYIHGNYLASSLPSLDGSAINWSSVSNTRVSLIVSIVVILIYFSLSIKYKTEKVVKYSNYVTLVVLVMLSVSLTSVLLTTKDLYVSKINGASTDKNIEIYSNNKNFLIFVLDAVDSVIMENVIKENKEFNNLFDDFTYYPDTMGSYPFTRDAVPFIISGLWNENETDYMTYSSKVYKNSSLLNTLKEKSYELNYYDYELYFNDKSLIGFPNYLLCNINYLSFFKQIIKYDIYKYFPYYLKKYSRIETLNFNLSKYVDGDYENFSWYNDTFVTNMKSKKIKLSDSKQFKFIHIEGGHVPFDLDKDLNKIQDGTYNQKLEATLTTIKFYLDTLKNNNVYDNSVIIVMADHGYNFEKVDGRQNPMLFIKGVNEKHEMIKSNIPVSFEDFNDAYSELINEKSSKDLFLNIPLNRKRRYIWYEYLLEDHMVEYEQTGKAWDETTMKKTGKEFNR